MLNALNQVELTGTYLEHRTAQVLVINDHSFHFTEILL